MKRIAVYAASFDPLTLGHAFCINQGQHLFDQLIVAVGNNPDKKYTFTIEERTKMISGWANQYRYTDLIVDSYEKEYLADYVKRVGAKYILRGIRNIKDFEYEKSLAEFNVVQTSGEATTVLIFPPVGVEIVSSSFVKGLVGFKDWERVLSRYVPENIRQAMIKKFNGEFC